jgi:hypothetical protein
MASKIAAFTVELDNGDGTTTLLPAITTKVWDVAADANVATVVTDANGYFPETTVSGAVGSLYRVRVENYHGRAGSYLVASVA